MSYTPISKMTDDLNVISGLPNRPSDSGYNATTLKAAFDEAANAIKDYINGRTVDNEYVNGLVDELNAKLSSIEYEVSEFRDLQFPDGVIKTDMIDGLQVTEAKLAQNAVTRGKILDGEVVAGKLGNGAVAKANMGTRAVDTDNIEYGAVTPDRTTGIQKQIKYTFLSIPSAAWYLDTGYNCWVAQIDRVDSLGAIADPNKIIAKPRTGLDASWVPSYNSCASNHVRLGGVTNTKFIFFAYSQPSVQLEMYLCVLDID